MRLWSRQIVSRNFSNQARWVSLALISTLFIASVYSAEVLHTQRNLRAETDTIAQNNEKLRNLAITSYKNVAVKITEAESLGADVSAQKTELATNYALILTEHEYLQAATELTTQLASVMALITSQTAAIEAEKQKGTLSGVVKEGDNPLSGVKVALKEGSSELGSVLTGTDGRYLLTVKAGSWTLVGSKSGYTSHTKSGVTISAGQTATYDFSLSKAPAAPPPTSAPPPSSVLTNGDSSYEVVTVKGYTVHLSKFNLASGEFRVITDTANDNDCVDNCPTKSLSSYVSDHGAFAGMNGTYFCPADYSSCAGKTGSFYWKVWNSRLSKMINGSNGSFEYEPFLTVNGNTAKYYGSWSSFSGTITAGISSSPALVSGGSNVLNQSNLDSKQKTVKSNRGAMGLKGQVLYLAIAKSATVIDLADIMDELDVDYAMNVDGGGSSAMIYNNSYKVGPGRSLPNALVVARR
ncbi:MAG: phosphodiester glycosidase family protein [Candidatus Berkelbacteria bacterium]|nr:MAG: phosphodiester glycosidase family protein [Candidatus Berkelbacteria bacterium]QQG51516.1 MAG: phosphodiester glycosidase family protein [Candidatus Berkelbacteria bacterium]